MAVTTGQVNALYQELLGRSGAEQYLSDWANSGMTIDQIRTAIANTPEGQAAVSAGTNTNVFGEETVGSNDPVQGMIEVLFERHFGRMPTASEVAMFAESYSQNNDPDALNQAIMDAAQTNFGATEASGNTATSGTNTNAFGEETAGSNDAVLGTIEVLFERHFGRFPTEAEAQSFLAQYNESGDIDAVDAAISQAAQTNFGETEASEGIQAGAELEAMRPVVQELYQELFGREAGQQGMDYWLSQLRSGATTPEGLRDALISGATGADLEYYNQNVLNTGEPIPDDEVPDPGEDPPVVEDEPDDGTGTTDTTTTTDGTETDTTTTDTTTTDTTTTDPTTTTTDPTTTTPTGTGVGTTGTGTEDPTAQTGGGTPGVNQYQGLFDILDQRYPNLGGKGGTQQPQAPIISEPEPNPYAQGGGDFYSGGGYYRNPYSSGFGMGYQDPYASQRYMPRQGLLGPSGFGGGKGGMSPYGSPYESPYGSPYGSSFGSPYGSPYSSPYGSPYSSPYGSPYGSPYQMADAGMPPMGSPGKGGGFSRPPTPAKGGGFGQPQLPPRDTTGLTPMGGGNSLANGINDGTIAMQPGNTPTVEVNEYGNRVETVTDPDGTVHVTTFLPNGGQTTESTLPGGATMISDGFPQFDSQTQGGQQGRLSQAAVLGGMDPSSDQIMGAPKPPITTPPPFPPPSYTPPTTIVDDFGPYSQAQVGPVRPRSMMAQPAGMRYRQPMSYGGKGGYYR